MYFVLRRLKSSSFQKPHNCNHISMSVVWPLGTNDKKNPVTNAKHALTLGRTSLAFHTIEPCGQLHCPNLGFFTFTASFAHKRNRHPKSFYRSHAGRHFYKTENEILAGYGPVGYTEKKNLANFEQLAFSWFFMFS